MDLDESACSRYRFRWFSLGMGFWLLVTLYREGRSPSKILDLHRFPNVYCFSVNSVACYFNICHGIGRVAATYKILYVALKGLHTYTVLLGGSRAGRRAGGLRAGGHVTCIVVAFTGNDLSSR